MGLTPFPIYRARSAPCTAVRERAGVHDRKVHRVVSCFSVDCASTCSGARSELRSLPTTRPTQSPSCRGGGCRRSRSGRRDHVTWHAPVRAEQARVGAVHLSVPRARVVLAGIRRRVCEAAPTTSHRLVAWRQLRDQRIARTRYPVMTCRAPIRSASACHSGSSASGAVGRLPAGLVAIISRGAPDNADACWLPAL